MKKKESSSELSSYDGKTVFIKTVTHYYTGKIVSMDDKFITLEKAAWIADTGRLSQMLTDKNVIKECEMYPVDRFISVAIGGIIEITEYPELPTETK